MYKQLPESNGSFVALRLSGKLDEDDYQSIIPMVTERIASHEKISLYWEMRDFDGWTADGLLSDAGFDVRHADDFTRIAMVGEKKWHDWMTNLMKPFTSAEVRYFDLSESEAAKIWARTGD